MHQSLDALIGQLGRQPQQPVEFGANLWFAHEAWIEAMPQDVLDLYVDALAETGARRIDINVGLFPWMDRGTPRGEETVAKYDAIVQRIRRAGLQLVLNPQYSPAYHRLERFEDWTRRALDFYGEVARRYRPEVLIVVHEPTTMASRLNATVTASEWADFAGRAAGTVKAASPRTRCGAGGLSSELEFFRAFAALPELDVLTLDVYDLATLPTYTGMTLLAEQSGKPVYIEETWRTPFAVPGPGDTADTIASRGVGDRGFKEIDAKWLRALTLYARVRGLEAVTPSWTQPFFKYVPEGEGDALDPAYTLQVIQALRNGERTDTFFAFRDLVRGS
jgi:hypothetical protein